MYAVIRKLNNFFDKNKNLAPLFIRIAAGFHLIYVTKNAAFNSAKMQGVVEFFASQKIPIASLLAPLAVYAEFICGILFISGLFTRAAAIVMVFVFIWAVSIVHIGDSYTNTFPALVMLAGSLSLLFSGSGNFSLDALLKRTKQAAI